MRRRMVLFCAGVCEAIVRRDALLPNNRTHNRIVSERAKVRGMADVVLVLLLDRVFLGLVALAF